MFKYNDHIAEGQLDLGRYFRQAYKLRETVKLFPTVHPKAQQQMEEARIEVSWPVAFGGGGGRGRGLRSCMTIVVWPLAIDPLIPTEEGGSLKHARVCATFRRWGCDWAVGWGM